MSSLNAINCRQKEKPTDIIAWAESSGIKVDGHSFDSTRTPQLIKPMIAMADADTRIGTLIKPVQVGGSTAGEIVCAYWSAFYNGLIQFNWEDDRKAVNRWSDRILPTLESCRDIKRTGGRFEELICTARYINTTVRVQGVFNESSLDSDTVPLQINEEVHLWKSGFLGKARRRQTQVWNAKAFDISNASNDGDQLHLAHDDGTMEQWEIACPQCGKLHAPHFRWNENKPELGGLRWDSSGAKMDKGRYNYNKLAKTIRYELPCGHIIRDIPAERRTIKGDYSAPRNEGAHVSHRSWNFEAVSCPSIPWLTLVQEWHSALRSLKSGDNEPMRRFVTERECRFYSEEMRPFQGRVVVNTSIEKSRDGIPARFLRLWAADKQRGYKSKGDLSHFWLVIRDVDSLGNSLLVYEGRVETESDLVATLQEHDCQPTAGGVDCGYDMINVLEFCMRFGCHAFFGAKTEKKKYPHSIYTSGKPITLWKFYSDPYKIDNAITRRLKLSGLKYNAIATKDGYILDHREPVCFDYNLSGMLDNLFFLRNFEGGIKWEVPGDVSEDYKLQNEAWDRTSKGFEQTRADDHMLMCEGYIALMMDQSGVIASRLTALGLRQQSEKLQ